MPGQFDTIKFRRGTAALWSMRNTILDEAEPGYETNTKKLKIGDGFTPWTALPYYGGGDGLPIDEEDIAEIVAEVERRMELSDLVLLWENAKA